MSLPPHRSSGGMSHRHGRARGTGSALLPQDVRDNLRQGAWRLWGMMLVALSAVGMVSVFTYAPSDPSWNTATTASLRNAVGVPGAIFSDILVQTFGVGSLVPFGLLALWGLRLMVGLPVRWVIPRLFVLFLSLPFVSVGLTMASQVEFFPLPNGTSGFIGILLLDHLQSFASSFGLDSDLHQFGAIAGAVVAGVQLWWVSATRLSDGHEVLKGVADIGRAAASLRSHHEPSAEELRKTSASFPFGLGLRARRDEDEEEEAAPVAVAALRTEPTFSPSLPDGETQEKPVATCDESGLPPSGLSAGSDVGEGEKPAIGVGDTDAHSGADVPPGVEGTVEEKQVAALGAALKPRSSSSITYVLPPLELLPRPLNNAAPEINEELLARHARSLEGVLKEYSVNGDIVEVRPGPVVTLYELEPVAGTRTARVVGLSDDIARSMNVASVRIAVVTGKSTIGIELPNSRRETVSFRDLVADQRFQENEYPLLLALGRDIAGDPVYVDLSRMPHLLMAGADGSGKSVALNAMICSLLFRLTPRQCRFIMIDPGTKELSRYRDIPHLMTPVIRDAGEAIIALKWAVREMESRYRSMSQMGVRSITSYNARLKDAADKKQMLTRTIQVGFDSETGKPQYEEQALDMTPLPFIVVIVDEMADLMTIAGKDVETALQRLAQMARAAGIHLVMTTRRPGTDVITGAVKANFPARISFQVSGKIDSRMILGEQGAEQLLGQGDMLYMPPGGKVQRVHGSFVSEREVDAVVAYWREQGAPAYVDTVLDEKTHGESLILDRLDFAAGNDGPELFSQAVALVASEQKVSINILQRHFQIGYDRAARLIERMEREGMVSQANNVGRRTVLLPPPAPVAADGAGHSPEQVSSP